MKINKYKWMQFRVEWFAKLIEIRMTFNKVLKLLVYWLSALNNRASVREREGSASRFRGLACNFHGVVINSLRSRRTCWQLYSDGNIRTPIERCATLVNIPRMVCYAEKRLHIRRSRLLVRVFCMAFARIDAIAYASSRRIRVNIQIPIARVKSFWHFYTPLRND